MPLTRIRIEADGDDLQDVTRCLDAAVEAIFESIPAAFQRDEDVIKRKTDEPGWDGRCIVYLDRDHILQPDRLNDDGERIPRYVAEAGLYDKGQVAWWAVFDRGARAHEGVNSMLLGELDEHSAHRLAQILNDDPGNRASILIDRWYADQAQKATTPTLS